MMSSLTFDKISTKGTVDYTDGIKSVKVIDAYY